MNNDPQQELFTKLKLELEAKGYAVYDGVMPPEGTPYPFIYLGDSQQIDDSNKTAIFGDVHQTINIWHNNPRQRGTLSGMLLSAKGVCRNIKKTANFNWTVKGITQNIIPDTTTKTPLLHGILNVHFYFSQE